jgi:hypothetical protein
VRLELHSELCGALVWQRRLQWIVWIVWQRADVQRLGSLRVLAELCGARVRTRRMWRLVRLVRWRLRVQREFVHRMQRGRAVQHG